MSALGHYRARAISPLQWPTRSNQTAEGAFFDLSPKLRSHAEAARMASSEFFSGAPRYGVL